MKIKEVLIEFNQEAPDVLPQVAQDYKKGADAVDKWINPKRWFGQSSDSSNARIKKHLSNSEVRHALDLAIKGQVRQNDIGALKQIQSNISNGTFKVSNPKSVKKSLELAMTGSQLSTQQIEELKVVLKSFY